MGLLHTKDLVRWVVSGNQQASLMDLIRPVSSVHESVTADKVIRLVPPLILTTEEADQIVAILAPLVRQFLSEPAVA